MAIAYLVILAVIGLFSNVIATNNGLIPFGPEQILASDKTYESPGSVVLDDHGSELTHYFGTDQIGRDVASRLVHGIPMAYMVGIFSSVLSLFIALILGGLSGFIGDKEQRINLYQIIWIMVGVVITHHFASEFSYMEDDRGVYASSISIYSFFLLLGFLIMAVIFRWLGSMVARSFWVPWDTMVVKLIEVFRSIPRLFFLLAIFAAITKPSVLSVILVIGIIRWPALTRLIRAEIMKIKQDDFVRSALILGLSNFRILFRHIAPNIYKPIIVLTAFNMGSAILIEATLSFLQIGLPLGSVSWGAMLGDARSYIPAWWMAVGPGLLIFSLILAFNVVGERLSYHFKVNHRDI